MVVVVRGGIRVEDIVVEHAFRDGVADALPEAVALVGPVVDGKEAPVLGVEDEEEPVEEYERRLADVLEVAARRVVEGPHETREDPVEDDGRKVLGNLFLVALPLGQGVFEEGGCRAIGEDEGVAVKEQVEHAQVMLVCPGSSTSSRYASKYAVARGRVRAS